MAKNTSDIVDILGLKRVSEMDWGEKLKVGDVEIEAIQVKHFGWRYPWEVDRSMGVWEGRSFNAYLLTKKGHSVLFGGDMGYHEFFKTIGQRNLSIELAILPIGTYKPWIQNHCNPEQALVMTEHLRAKRILPIHFKSFIMSDEPVEEPIQRLKEASKSNPNCVALDRIGQTWTMTESVEKS
jgi:L-ascorbate metabolism protein UlaG (beta-lactamase superfamily)